MCWYVYNGPARSESPWSPARVGGGRPCRRHRRTGHGRPRVRGRPPGWSPAYGRRDRRAYAYAYTWAAGGRAVQAPGATRSRGGW